MRFAVRVHDNNDGGGVAEPRIRIDTIYVLSQGKIEADWSRIGALRPHATVCWLLMQLTCLLPTVLPCCRHNLRPPPNLLTCNSN